MKLYHFHSQCLAGKDKGYSHHKVVVHPQPPRAHTYEVVEVHLFQLHIVVQAAQVILG